MTPQQLSAMSLDDLCGREWLATNGLGGFACSTIAGLNTRKYHGLLVAAMAPPVRRMVLLSRVEEVLRSEQRTIELACNEYPGTIHPQGHRLLTSFRSRPLPQWTYAGEGWTLHKSLQLARGQNTVLLSYELGAGSQAVELSVRPLLALRPIHELMFQWNGRLDAEASECGRRLRVPATAHTPEVFFAHDGRFRNAPCWYFSTIYRAEIARGYAGLEDLWSCGEVAWTLSPGQTVHLACSAEPVEIEQVVVEAQRQLADCVPMWTARIDTTADRGEANVVLALAAAAEQFIVQSRSGSPAIMSGYPWASISLRDALIAMPGLLLVTGKLSAARRMLGDMGSHLREGLLPTHVAEDGSGWTRAGADTSLWFIAAIHEYLRYAPRDEDARDLCERANAIVSAYLRGTDLGIAVDEDGLLRSSAAGVPTTWMDARTDDWVVTPRQGRPVELNALWHNALRVTADLSIRCGLSARGEELIARARRMAEAFNRRFWHSSAECCFDVVEDHGVDPSIRPNQILAMSLPYPVLDASRQAAVLGRVRQDLLTPMGLRTLSPQESRYQGRCLGAVVHRDRARHQGSVFPWLLGPMVSAQLRMTGRGAAARQQALAMLRGPLSLLADPHAGQIGELFDGDAPHAPGGLIASAPAVGELLRCYVEDILDQAPPTPIPSLQLSVTLPAAARARA